MNESNMLVNKTVKAVELYAVLNEGNAFIYSRLQGGYLEYSDLLHWFIYTIQKI